MSERDSRLLARVRTPSPALVGLALSLLIAAALGYVLADQVVSPSKRVIEALMGAGVLIATLLLPSRYSVGFMLFIMPFPLYTTIGSTTVLFAYVIFAFWLLRVALGMERSPIAAGIELPLIIVTLLYIISFSMVQEDQWRYAVAQFRTYISAVLIFYLVINLIRSERDIQFTVNVLIASFALVGVIGLVEVWAPQYSYILNALHIKSKVTATYEGSRIGSAFGDYEMFAEYLAIFIPVLLVRVLTEKQVLRQLIWVPLLGIAVMLLLATATRGAFVSLIAGIGYLIWISRRILNFQRLLPILIVASVIFYVSAILLNQYSSTASLFGRLEETKFVRGMPDTRARIWTETWERIEDSPWIGHGPYYFVGVNEKNVKVNYPHSLFLFLSYCIGIPGAFVFYWLLFIVLRRSLRAARLYANRRSELAHTIVILSSTLVIFLVDEIKISFLRYDNTQQFTWAMLALLLGSSRIAIRRAKEAGAEIARRGNDDA